MSRLHNAVQYGDIEAVRECLAAGMDVNAVGIRGTTPLQIAARHGFPKVVRELLRAGADPNFAAKGSLPLANAASAGHLAVVKILVEAGAEINANQGGSPAVNLAAMFGRDEVVAYLQEQGADFDIPDNRGKTANEWLKSGGVWKQSSEIEEHFRVGSQRDTEFLRKLMVEHPDPDEYVAKHGRNILVFSYGAKSFEDKAVEQWAHRLGEILQNSALLAECEERYLTGEELEAARKVRAKKEQSHARWER